MKSKITKEEEIEVLSASGFRIRKDIQHRRTLKMPLGHVSEPYHGTIQLDHAAYLNMPLNHDHLPRNHVGKPCHVPILLNHATEPCSSPTESCRQTMSCNHAA